MLTPKERLLAKLNGRKTDRPPVICTGGMMNAAIVEIMQQSGHTLPEAHTDAALMADLAGAIYEQTGFENIGIPFCMTVEAEVLGSDVTYGTLECEPKITRELFAAPRDVTPKNIAAMLADGRIATVVAAADLLAKRYPDVPVIGNITGPVSAAASLVDPVELLKQYRKDPAECHRVMRYISDLLIAFARQMAESGVNAISIGDPTATGEILGPKIFREFAAFYLNQVIDALHASDIPVIVHICGNMNTVRPQLPTLHANAISTDAMVNLKQLKTDFPEITTMGNLSTYLLELGSAAQVAEQTRRLVADGIDIISPACGLSTSTSLELIRAMTGSVKEG
ncbi:uroporphyrinogen decarboxylase family protein [Azotosporobacter soli]|uniref:uroporphyrinogen decarboxylase family protein n=1 Tax=Azotosporobacter soli TaxID=3055040 RepID=UPI0031FF12DB